VSLGSPKSPPNGLAKPIPYILATDCVMLPIFPIRLVSVPAACRQGAPSGVTPAGLPPEQ